MIHYRGKQCQVRVGYMNMTETAKYTTRETAGGVEVLDGTLATVTKIQGDTVKSINLITLPYSFTTYTVEGITFTALSSGGIKVSGTATATAIRNLNKTPCIGLNLASKNGEVKTGKGYTVAGGVDNVVVAINASDGMAYMYVEGGKTVNTTIYPMVVKGEYTLATLPAWTPYFDGLKNAYIDSIKSTGKNLLDMNTMKKVVQYEGYTYLAFDLPPLEVGKKYTLSTNIPTFHWVKIGINVGSYNDVISDKANSPFTFTMAKNIRANPATPRKLYLADTWKGFADTDISNLDGYYVQLEEGETATEFEPYKEDTYQLPQAIELGKWDYIDIERKKVVRYTQKVELTGDEFWGTSSTATSDKKRFPLYLSRSGLPQALNRNSLICNVYDTITNDNTYANKNGVSTDGGEHIYFYDEACATNVTNWRAYVKSLYDAGTPIIIEYCTADPIVEEDIDIPETYKVWNKGRETINQGETDNSIYGAELTLTTDYKVAGKAIFDAKLPHGGKYNE